MAYPVLPIFCALVWVWIAATAFFFGYEGDYSIAALAAALGWLDATLRGFRS